MFLCLCNSLHGSSSYGSRGGSIHCVCVCDCSGSVCSRTCGCCLTLLECRCRPSQRTLSQTTPWTRTQRILTNACPVRPQFIFTHCPMSRQEWVNRRVFISCHVQLCHSHVFVFLLLKCFLDFLTLNRLLFAWHCDWSDFTEMVFLSVSCCAVTRPMFK